MTREFQRQFFQVQDVEVSGQEVVFGLHPMDGWEEWGLIAPELSCSLSPQFIPSSEAHNQDSLCSSILSVRILLEIVRGTIWSDPCPLKLGVLLPLLVILESDSHCPEGERTAGGRCYLPPHPPQQVHLSRYSGLKTWLLGTMEA